MMSSTLLDKLLRFVLRCFYRTLHLPQKFQKGDNHNYTVQCQLRLSDKILTFHSVEFESGSDPFLSLECAFSSVVKERNLK